MTMNIQNGIAMIHATNNDVLYVIIFQLNFYKCEQPQTLSTLILWLNMK